jgi:hypothetical protein
VHLPAGSPSGQFFQLGAIALQLLPLGLDHLGRRIGDEALIRLLALRPLDLAPEAIAKLVEAA